MWVSVMGLTLRQGTTAGSPMQRSAIPLQRAVWVRAVARTYTEFQFSGTAPITEIDHDERPHRCGQI